MKQTLSYGLEAIAVILVAIIVADVAAPVWALLPIAVYLVLVAISLRSSGSSPGGQ